MARESTREALRQRVGGSVRKLVVGTTAPIQPDPWPAGDPGPIPLDSPVRTVHADPAAFVGGVRSLLYQTLHPVTMYAVAQHSDYERDPLGRLNRTAHFIGATTFGNAEEANQAVEIVRNIHATVIGAMPDGTLYRADDPHLLGWVHATEVDSFLSAHQRYGRQRLSFDEADRYVADMAVIATALGVDDPPLSQAELVAVLDSYHPELEPTPECRAATRFLFAPPLPITVLPFYGVIFSSAVALLPRSVRAMLLLPVAPGLDPLVLQPATRALTRALSWALGEPPKRVGEPAADQGGSTT